MGKVEELEERALQLEGFVLKLRKNGLPIDAGIRAQQARSLREEAIELREIRGQTHFLSAQAPPRMKA